MPPRAWCYRAWPSASGSRWVEFAAGSERRSPMTAPLLDGKMLAQTMQPETAAGVAEFVRDHGYRPGLATVLVGENDASQRYVRNKRKTCQQLGMESRVHDLPATV